MKVCIVGISGKLGRYMLQHALDRGHTVMGVCRPQSVHKLQEKILTPLLRLMRVADIHDQVEACRRVFASDTRWTVVRVAWTSPGSWWRRWKTMS